MMTPVFSPGRVGLVALLLAVFAPIVSAQTLPDRPTGSGPAPLSSSDVSDAEVESAAEIIVSLQMQEAEMERKYGEPDDMTKQQLRQVQQETMRERQLLLQKKTLEEDLDAGRLELIMISAKKDSTLHRRMRTAMEEAKEKKRREGAGATTQDTSSDRR